MNKKIMINILSYYLAWWGIATLAMSNHLIAIILIAFLFLFIHFTWVVPSENKLRISEMKMILFFSIIGISTDSILHNVKLFTLKENFLIWLFCIWIIFSATINYSLDYFLKQKSLIVFLVGGLAGPLTYYLASKLSLIVYPISLLNLFVHFLVWGFIVLSFKYRRKFYEQIN